MNDVTQFWQGHYQNVAHNQAGEPVTWLDYSNEKVQAQSLLIALEAAGPLNGRQCLDVGCGWGQLSRLMVALGAKVTAIDLTTSVINKLVVSYPEVNWQSGDFMSAENANWHAFFDVIMAVEVLQYVDFKKAVFKLWQDVKPGGRLVGMVPNAECPFVQRAMEKYPGRYRAVSAGEMGEALNNLPGNTLSIFRNLIFGKDQSLVPYVVSDWSNRFHKSPDVPNRFHFVALKTTVDLV